jgi:hypothetical protein
VINQLSVGSLLVFVGIAAGLSHTLAADSSIATQLEENRVTQERQVVSPSGQWRVSLGSSREDYNYKLVLESRSGVKHEIDESGKPDFRIVWSEAEHYVAVSKPTGFTTMISIYALAKDSAMELFSSAKTNQWPYVDYALDKWDMGDNRAVLKVYENPRYLEMKRSPRLLAVIYVYLDGKTDYGSH